MAVLTREDVLKEIQGGAIRIDPFHEDQVGPGSIDLRLGNEFRVFKKLRNALVVEENISLEDLTERVVVEDSFTLMPGETVLGITQERIRLPSNICGWLEGRSRFARIGLVIHMTASFVQPGVDNRQVLEIGKDRLSVAPGDRRANDAFGVRKRARARSRSKPGILLHLPPSWSG